MDAYLNKKLLSRHYQRTLYVVQLLSSVAKKYGLDERQAIMAGMLHLVSRQMRHDEMLSYVAKRDSRLLERLPEQYQQVYYLTGPASAWFALEELDERSDEVFRGIRDHTLLYRNPSQLAKCLHAATTITSADQNDPRTAVLMCDFMSGRLDRVLKELNRRDVRSLEKTDIRRLARITNPDFRKS
ncbi:MAG: hypothetical protein ACOYUZ_05885 [Patescibacteria group bacterium]